MLFSPMPLVLACQHRAFLCYDFEARFWVAFNRPLFSPVHQTNLRQLNRTSSADSVYGGNSTRSRDGGHWDGSIHGSAEEREELNKELERKMQEELSAFKQQGKDVDRLVMKNLMARVRDSEPNIAFKALASIEVYKRV